MKKNTVIELLNHLEGEFAIEELIQKIVFVDKVDSGLKEVVMGKAIDYEQAKRNFTDRYNKKTN